MWKLRFSNQASFLDQQLTKDGKPFGPIRYKQLVEEAFLISKNSSTSYNEVLKMTPLERRYVVGLLVDEANRNKQMLEESKAQLEQKQKNRK